MGNNKNLMYLVCLFVTVLSILVWGLGINWRSSTMLALGAVAITSLLISKTSGIRRKSRIVLFCSWGLLFAILVVASSTIQYGHFICPSKIALAGEKAGIIPKIPGNNSTLSH